MMCSLCPLCVHCTRGGIRPPQDTLARVHMVDYKPQRTPPGRQLSATLDARKKQSNTVQRAGYALVEVVPPSTTYVYAPPMRAPTAKSSDCSPVMIKQ